MKRRKLRRRVTAEKQIRERMKIEVGGCCMLIHQRSRTIQEYVVQRKESGDGSSNHEVPTEEVQRRSRLFTYLKLLFAILLLCLVSPIRTLKHASNRIGTDVFFA